MTESSSWRLCPCCPDLIMQKQLFGRASRVEVDRCVRCGGLWLEHGKVQRLRAIERSAIPEHPGLRIALCRHCSAPVDRDAEQCPACAQPNTLHCPDCSKPMHTVTRDGLRLDICQACRGAWFDHHELEAIWGAQVGAHLAKAVTRQHATPGSVDTASRYGGADLALDTLFFAPGLVVELGRGVGHTVAAAGSAATHLPEAISALPDVAAGAVEGVGEVATGVFEAIMSIISGLFD